MTRSAIYVIEVSVFLCFFTCKIHHSDKSALEYINYAKCEISLRYPITDGDSFPLSITNLFYLILLFFNTEINMISSWTSPSMPLNTV